MRVPDFLTSLTSNDIVLIEIALATVFAVFPLLNSVFGLVSLDAARRVQLLILIFMMLSAMYFGYVTYSGRD